MGKWLLRIGAALIILVIVAGLVLYFTIDGLVRSGITSGATAATGTDTDLTTAHISVFGNSGLDLEGLELANPKGFDKKNFLSLDDGNIDVSLGSLMSDKVVIPNLKIRGLTLLVENKGTTLNLRVIQKRLAQMGGGGTSKPKPKSKPKTSGEGKKFIIKHIELQDMKVVGSLGGIPGVDIPQLDAKLPDLTLDDVGSDTGGATLKQVVSQILDAVLDKGGDVITSQGGVSLDKFTGKLKDMTSQARTKVKNAAGNARNKATKAAKNASKKASKQVKDAGNKAKEKVNEGVNKVGKQLEGILGGGKQDDQSNQ